MNDVPNDPTADTDYDLEPATDAPIGVPLVSNPIGRRRFLTLSGAGAGAIAATAWIRPSWFTSVGAASNPAAGVNATTNTLVYVFLRGAADGLSFIAPIGDATYHDARPGVAIGDAEALPLDARFGLHPAAVRLKEMFDQGTLALIPAAGSPERNRSHFSMQDAMDKGTPGDLTTPDGWLGRYLHATAGVSEATLRALGIGSSMTPSLRGGGAVAAPNLQSLSLAAAGSTATTAQLRQALGAMYSSATHDALRAQATAGLAVVDQISPIAQNAAPPTTWPTGFGTAFWPVAKLLADGFPIEIATIDLGGWDTHDAMGAPTDTTGRMYGLVTKLDTALGAFFDHLGPKASDVTVVVVTEFGRRIKLNGTGGTDHGRGMTMMVAGAGVNGGVKGQWPGLVDTDSGDVKVVNDYRTVLAEVLDRRMRDVDLATVFPRFDTSPSTRLGVMT